MTVITEEMSRHGYRSLFFGHPDATYLFDVQGKFLDCNDTLVRLVGRTRDEVLSMGFAPIIHPSFVDVTAEGFARALSGHTSQYLTRGIRGDGSFFDVDVTNIPLVDDSGSVFAVAGIARDAGHVYALSELAKRNSAVLNTAGRIAKFGGWSVEADTGEVYWSSELFRMLNIESDAGAPPFNLALNKYPEPHRSNIERAVEACMTECVPIDLEAVLIDGTGRALNVRISGDAIQDETGKVVRVAGGLVDITDVQAEREERARAQSALNITLDRIQDPICFLDSERKVTFVNTAACTLLGVPSQLAVGRKLEDLVPGTVPENVVDAYRFAVKERLAGRARGYFEGLGRWLDLAAHPNDGGVALIFRDVSDEVAAELASRERADRDALQAALLDAARDAILVFSVDQQIEYANSSAQLLFDQQSTPHSGVAASEALGVDASELENVFATVLQHGEWSGELTHNLGGTLTTITDGRWQHVRSVEGRPASVLAVLTDVTSERQRDLLRHRDQRLESLGTLAGGIAHDLNNVLAPVLMASHLLSMRSTSEEDVALLQSIEVSATRGADLIRQVLSFARGTDGPRTDVDVRAVLDDVQNLVKDTLPKNVTLIMEAGDLATISGDSTQILQVILNLVTNASDAMPDGGVIQVNAHNMTLPPGDPALARIGSDRCVVVTVTDGGFGMDDATLTRIFEPFFTTKGVGKGTGLGLATSMSILRSHSGDMTVVSAPGRGTTFAVYLPEGRTSGGLSSFDETREELPLGNGELVLVVDDEEAIRQTICQTLRAHGYQTVEANNGREAIEVAEASAHPIDLVLTDMMMPIMDGAATASYFFEHHPTIAVVAVSGLTATGAVTRATHVGVQYFIPKPFTTPTLLRTIKSALNERQARHQ